MLRWARTEYGWAVNLDGSDAARSFALPRLELHVGPGGWTGICHLPDGTSRPVAVEAAPTAVAARRMAAGEALRAVGPPWDAALRTLL